MSMTLNLKPSRRRSYADNTENFATMDCHMTDGHQENLMMHHMVTDESFLPGNVENRSSGPGWISMEGLQNVNQVGIEIAPLFELLRSRLCTLTDGPKTKGPL
jgi:hypothetical protein